jgi:hypothetical protein
MRALVPLALLTVLAACGETEGSPATRPAPAPASLVVVHSLDTSGPMYIEGAAWHLEVVDASGDLVFTKDLLDSERQVVELVPGRYEVRSAERPCEGNCSMLDPPDGDCALTVDVPEEGLTVKIDAAAGRPCRPSVV